ncbi:dienelactone hydrolase family protein [Rhabdaerophilum calidifontis]|uniref:dienelactone hydrolase family protein n=1 Tax=Rhabdaerophilum calidifontis TaxID=2604328 RepID=UPI00123B8348|nr:dienelactone hydrolase family protein [Rhabdaerophilum calidifontis]
MLVTLRLLIACAVGLAALGAALAGEWVTYPGRGGHPVKALMMRPDGGGPFPAIIALHGCAGLGSARGLNPRHSDWGQRLRDAGFLVLFPDSFGSRGLGSQCTERDREIDLTDRRDDIFAAAEWLAARPDIQKRRIGLLGWSNGAMALLHATNAGARPSGVEFARAVAFYPGCKTLLRKGYSARVPVTILHGLADDWTAAEPCRQLPGVRFIGYPGAYHSFDHPNLPIRTRKAAFSANGSGTVTIGTHPEARADAIGRVMAIFQGM